MFLYIHTKIDIFCRIFTEKIRDLSTYNTKKNMNTRNLSTYNTTKKGYELQFWKREKRKYGNFLQGRLKKCTFAEILKSI